MNTLLKGIIVTLATIFGFALIAAGVSIAVSPSADTSAVAKRDHVVAKRDNDSSPVLSVTQDDDDNDDLADDNGAQTRTRTGHRANARAGMADDNGVADDNGQTRTRTRTGHRANARAGMADDNGVADDNGQTRTRTGHRAGDDHGNSGSGNSGSGGGDDHSRDFSRDLTNND